jgi:hypothetical protein
LCTAFDDDFDDEDLGDRGQRSSAPEQLPLDPQLWLWVQELAKSTVVVTVASKNSETD